MATGSASGMRKWRMWITYGSALVLGVSWNLATDYPGIVGGLLTGGIMLASFVLHFPLGPPRRRKVREAREARRLCYCAQTPDPCPTCHATPHCPIVHQCTEPVYERSALPEARVHG